MYIIKENVNRVYIIKDKEGIFRDKFEDIEKVFLDVYKELLGIQAGERCYVNSTVVRKGKVV